MRRGFEPACNGLPMPEWEYITLDLSYLPRKISELDVLNDAGKDGWELVMITSNNIAYLKRPIPRRSSHISRPTTSGETRK
jgi:hypothetical protein